MAFGQLMRSLMDDQGISLRELAREVYCDYSYLSRIANGKRTPSFELAAKIDDVLKANQELSSLIPSERKDEPETAQHEALTLIAREEEMERRRLLESLAALGIAVSPAGQALEHIRNSVAHTFESRNRQQIDHWEEIAVDYGYSYLASPPDDFIKDLAVDLVTMRLVTRDIDKEAAIFREWCRIGATLFSLMAKALSNLGQTREARHWWLTAKSASDDSGDLTARLWVRGQRLIHGLYENRPPQLLIRQANEAIELAQGHNCVGLACISGGRAQALALAGMPDAAEAELERAKRVFGELPQNIREDLHSVNGLGEDGFRYTQTWVHAHNGNHGKADAAAEYAMRLYPSDDHRSPVQIKLIQAFAHTQGGNILEGVQRARHTLEALPRAQQTTMINTLARRVLAPIPAEARQPDIAAYRELLETGRERANKNA